MRLKAAKSAPLHAVVVSFLEDEQMGCSSDHKFYLSNRMQLSRQTAADDELDQMAMQTYG